MDLAAGGLITVILTASLRIARHSAAQSMVQALLHTESINKNEWIKTSESAATKGIEVDLVEELELHVFHNF